MAYAWGMFWQRSRASLKICWLIALAISATYMGWPRLLNYNKGIAEQKATGLGAVAQSAMSFTPSALWGPNAMYAHSATANFIGGVPLQSASLPDEVLAPPGPPPPPPAERKTIRTSAMDLVVQSPAHAAEAISKLASHLGGFIVTSNVSGGANATQATITVRVPSDHFEEARADIRKLALHIESERIEAQDVTKQFVDREARLRNLRAQEIQYLSILRQAHTVKDTLEVSDKLNEVRGAIEEHQAEFAALSKQIETVAISVTLSAESDTNVFGLSWRPLYQLKLAARGGLDGLADYVASMTSFLFYVPTIFLWLITLLFGAAIGWRIHRWAAQVFFGWPTTTKQPA